MENNDFAYTKMVEVKRYYKSIYCSKCNQEMHIKSSDNSTKILYHCDNCGNEYESSIHYPEVIDVTVDMSKGDKLVVNKLW